MLHSCRNCFSIITHSLLNQSIIKSRKFWTSGSISHSYKPGSGSKCLETRLFTPETFESVLRRHGIHILDFTTSDQQICLVGELCRPCVSPRHCQSCSLKLSSFTKSQHLVVFILTANKLGPSSSCQSPSFIFARRPESTDHRLISPFYSGDWPSETGSTDQNFLRPGYNSQYQLHTTLPASLERLLTKLLIRTTL